MKAALNLLRFARFLAASLFVRKITPRKAFPAAQVVEHPIHSSVKTPELLSMRLFPGGRTLQNSEYESPHATGMVMPSVFFDPVQGLVLDHKRRAIEDSRQVPMRKHWYRWKPFFSRNIQEVGGYSYAFRSFRKHHYHLLTDHLPALFMLGKLEWAFEDEINFLVPGSLTAAEQYFIPKLCPDRVTIRTVDENRLLRLENYVYVSHLAQRSAGCLPQEYLECFQARFSPPRPRVKNKRIFISRAKSARRRILNEDELYTGLEQYGFTRYRLEEMSIALQIELFHDAEMVVSPHGAGLVNLLFSERVKLLELFPGPLLRPHFYYICKSMQHEYRYQCSRNDYRFPRKIWVDLDEEYNGSLDDFKVNCEDVFRVVEEMGA